MKNKQQRLDDIKKLKVKKDRIEREIQELEKYEKEREYRKGAKWDDLSTENQILKAEEMKQDIYDEKEAQREREQKILSDSYIHEVYKQSYYYPYPKPNMSQEERDKWHEDHDL
jgi:hypothetical protein